MSKPAFFVDGQTEQRSINKICPGHPIRLIGCNGKKVALSAIAKRLKTQIKLLNNRYYPIIILIDREDRKESIQEIKEELKKELIKIGVKDECLISVCDRMIENWILADKKNIIKHTGKKIYFKKSNYEGLKGKSIIKRYYSGYHETTDGVTLLSKSNPKTLCENSESFRDFAETIKKIECYWLAEVY